MDEKNNLEKFFQEKLQDFSEDTDGWNLPPENLWEEARLSFPDRKKKNRKGFFFLFFGICILFVGLLVYSQRGFFSNSSLKKEALVVEKKEIANHTKQDVVKFEEDENDENVGMQTAEIIKTESIKLAQKEETKNIRTTNHKPKQKNSTTINIKLEKAVVTNTPPMKNSTLDSSISNSIDEEIVINKNLSSDEKLDMMTTTPLEEEELLKFSLLPMIESKSVFSMNEKQPDFGFGNEKITLPIQNKEWNWEFGISHMWFIENAVFDENFEEDLDPGESITFEANYQNINIDLSKRLNKNWRISSGLNLSQQKLNINYFVLFPYYNFSQELKLTNDIQSYTNSTASFEGEEEGITLEYLEDIETVEGTDVDFNLGIGVNIRAVQIPIELSYRLKFFRFEFLTGAGISLDYFHGKMNIEPLKVYDEDVIINKNIEIPSITYTEFSWSITSSFMLKYKINKSLNIATFLRAEPFELAETRLGFGLYYRM